MTKVKAFVSYCWESRDHRDWVRKFADRLWANGIEVTLDQWHLRLGDSITEFIETAVRASDFVLCVCTPNYRQRSNERKGGVGYEQDIMSAELLVKRNHRKFIPVLRDGDWSNAAPSWLAGKFGANLRGDPYEEAEYQHLVDTLLGNAPKPPSGTAPVPGSSRPKRYRRKRSRPARTRRR